MKLNRLLYPIFISIISVFLFSCRETNKKDIKYENVNIYIKQKASVLHKKINALNTILGDTTNISGKVVYVYNALDCETCIDKGYSTTKKIDEIRKNKFVYVVTTSTSIAHEQLRNNYQEYVFYDEHDLIRKELKYIFTPVLFLFDSKMQIKCVFYPGLDNEDEERRFIYNCFK